MKRLIICAMAVMAITTAMAKSKTPAVPQVERWGTYEVSLTAPVPEGKNPFDVRLKATFCLTSAQAGRDGDSLTVDGFYDGGDQWKVRFMPSHEGAWSYFVHSELEALNQQGTFQCVAPSVGNHGPVQVDSTGLNFCYADGSRYWCIGTTSYDWMHASSDPSVIMADPGLTMQQQTLKSLSETGFTKIRSLLLPQNFEATYPEPEVFPFERKSDGGWDWTRPNPRYFDHVEACTKGLMQLGIEQDLILFHPYDGGRWGFDAMPIEAGERLCRYVAARMSSFRNVWWSLANEYDLVKAQPKEAWDAWTDAITQADPYHHLVSIHSYTAQYYSYWDNRYTHCSVQDQAPVEDFGRAAIVRNIYRKPVVFDEVLYEGNLDVRWGNLSGEEELFRMWQALIAGTYCSHSECYLLGDEKRFRYNFLAVGGRFYGTMAARTKFMKQVLDDLPMPMYLADSSWDPRTSAAGPGYFMVYLGKDVLQEWRFNLPCRNGRTPAYRRIQEGDKFEVEIIDTWNMTIEKYPVIFEARKQDNYRMIDVQNRAVRLPERPYLLLRIRQIDSSL